MISARMRRRTAALAVLVLLSLALSGCWDRVELADLDLVSGVAFDAVPNGGFRITASIVLPQNLTGAGGAGGAGGGGGGPAEAVVSATGATIGEAIAALGQGLPGHIFWGHTRVILIGEGLARRGVQPVLDFFLRSPETRLATDLLVVRGEAGPLLQLSPPFRVPGTDVLYEHLRRQREPRAFIYEVAQSIRTASGATLIPEVHVGPPAPGGSPGGGGSGGATAPPTLVFCGTGVLQRGRLTGWLNETQMRGAMWLLGTTRRATVELNSPRGTVTVAVDKVHIHRRAVRLAGGVPAVRIRIAAEGMVGEVDRGKVPLQDPQYLIQLSNILAASIRGEADAALAAARSEDVDFLQFGRLVAADQPALWNPVHSTWRQIFPTLRVVITVLAHVRYVGNLVRLS